VKGEMNNVAKFIKENSGPIISVLLVITLITFSNYFSKKNPEIKQSTKERLTLKKEVGNQNKFPEIKISAKSAIVYDYSRSEVLFQKNSEAELPLASLTKLMTVLISESNGREVVNFNLNKETKWNKKDLERYTLMTSSNEAALALAQSVNGEGNKDFVTLMNNKAKESGLRQTFFVNPTGLDVSSSYSGGYGSAYDTALLIGSVASFDSSVFSKTREKDDNFTSLSGEKYLAINTNPYSYKMPWLIGSKTGYTDLAGGNLAVIFDLGINHKIGIVVLGSSKEGRFEDVTNLYKATFDYFDKED
jgi:D-alanyl-D-alanine carboxypeptidase (penicillin-binding protein 5/6)